jgi:hypothetical protein
MKEGYSQDKNNPGYGTLHEHLSDVETPVGRAVATREENIITLDGKRYHILKVDLIASDGHEDTNCEHGTNQAANIYVKEL